MPQFQTGYWSKASATQYVGSSTGLFATDRTSRDRVTQSQDSTAASLDLTSEVTRSHQPCVGCGEGLHKVTPPGGRASWARSWRLESFLLINLLQAGVMTVLITRGKVYLNYLYDLIAFTIEKLVSQMYIDQKRRDFKAILASSGYSFLTFTQYAENDTFQSLSSIRYWQPVPIIYPSKLQLNLKQFLMKDNRILIH